MASNGEYLYDPKLLSNLDWPSVRPYLSNYITSTDPGEPWLLVRPLQLADFDKGYVQLLSQLTLTGNVTRANFESKS